MLTLVQLDYLEKMLSGLPDEEAMVVKNGTGWSVEWTDHSVLLEMGNDEDDTPESFARIIADNLLIKQLYGNYVEALSEINKLRTAFFVTFESLQKENESLKAQLLSKFEEQQDVQGEGNPDSTD